MNRSNSDLTTHFTTGRLQDFSEHQNCVLQKEIYKHSQYILYVITKGAGIQNVDFQYLEIKPGRVFFISPGQIHEINSESVFGFYLLFDLDFYHSVRSIFKLFNFPFFHTSLLQPYLDVEDQLPYVQLLLEQLLSEFSSNESFGKWSILRYGLENLLILFTRIKQKQNALDSGILIPNNEKLRKLDLLIEQHFRTHKEVAFYAEQLNISSRHLNNIISGKTGKSISQMIQERILIEAKRQLLHSEKNVMEIAYELGFNDKAYFHRFFKKFTFQTPQKFRADYK